MRIEYVEVATITVKPHWWHPEQDSVVVTVKRDSIQVAPPALPSALSRERTVNVAKLLASAAARGVFLHRRMFGRGPM